MNASNTVELMKSIDKAHREYLKSGDIKCLEERLYCIAKSNRDSAPLGDLLINAGDQYIEKGDHDVGILYIEAVHNSELKYNNGVTLYLRLAEHSFINGDENTGIEFLTKLCTETVDNYEEAIEARAMTKVFEKYRSYIEGKVPPSKNNFSVCTPLAPDECSMKISEITASKEDMLSNLSLHILELSGNGEYLNNLNKYEKIFFYIDELCTEINSGGFSNYLYYYGTHFEKAIASLSQAGADSMLSLCEKVKNKFPNNKLPKTLDALQRRIDKFEETGIDFEAEDDIYYEKTERELLEALSAFVYENQKKFR